MINAEDMAYAEDFGNNVSVPEYRGFSGAPAEQHCCCLRNLPRFFPGRVAGLAGLSARTGALFP